MFKRIQRHPKPITGHWPKSPYRRLARLEAALRGKDAEVDTEVSDLYREYQFRKTFGGSHEDFMNQPIQITEWLIAIDGIINEVKNG